MTVRWFWRVMWWAAGLSVLWALPAVATPAGSGWSVQRTPNPAVYSELAGVSCASGSVCVAVGLQDAGDYTQNLGGGLEPEKVDSSSPLSARKTAS